MSFAPPRRDLRRRGDTSAPAADKRPGSPRPPPRDRPGGPCTDPSRGRLADVDRSSGPPIAADPGELREPRQRWRLTFSRSPVEAARVGRVALDEWQSALRASGLPLADTRDGRARIAIAAPLPAAAGGDRELAEIWLVERRPPWALRPPLASLLPANHEWIDAEDVWLGEPPLPGRLVAAEWRLRLVASTWSTADLDQLAEAALAVNAASSIPRTRTKGGTEKRYDLRPLLADVRVEPGVVRGRVGPVARVSAGGPVVIVRTRFDPELGAGRPDEVIAVLSD